ncbi:outer membrane lipid asymmetry maintenance protein MlaD [Guyparkeria halophila]|uniref:Outer membrane lipid asymmetry maintenance protein MlaD n=1 Tax=Guyparkeria halophila TaxID=47960 RepID=A0A6I6CW87_9GAMM|nr:outer membrane lipid asymmetry maintenance protein MlaD [Guyparkeria halophila]QGT78636.1 outer membrane lipid asymmetry maintenance protein MlaD [Guyparkeria halophila]
MNVQRGVELVVGLFVLAGIAALMVMALQWSNFGASRVSGYEVTARFDNVGGLSVQSPVKLAGLTIGRVDSIEIHPETFQAEVRMVIDDQYDNLPTDSFANIYTAGLLGAQYVEISPGGALESLEDGDRITMTQSAIILESVVSKFLFDKAKE